MDLDFDGLFIESHIDPSNALSDKKQQLTPNELKVLLGSLIKRDPEIKSSGQKKVLNDLRTQIDQCDDELLQVLKKRMTISEQIGAYKKRENLTILQMGRWSGVLDDKLKKARNMGLNEQFIAQVFKHIHKESIALQNEVMNKKTDG
jgi:chorismate mutase